MNSRTGNLGHALVLITGIFFSGAVMAASNVQSNGHDGDKDRRPDHAATGNGAYFEQHQRTVVHEHFAKEKRKGKKCPPGLAKKNNGCNPPGQVKQWQLGQQLPNEVIRHQLPTRLEQQLGQAPAGYGYTRVDDDILLIELGSMIVYDMIKGLGE